jgi:hypothetical protein
MISGTAAKNCFWQFSPLALWGSPRCQPRWRKPPAPQSEIKKACRADK